MLAAAAAVAVSPAPLRAGQPGDLFDAAPGSTASYLYHAGEYHTEILPIDASFHFTHELPTTLTATFFKPIISARADGTPLFGAGAIVPLVVTAVSDNGRDFEGDLIENTQYMFQWHFDPLEGGGLLWNGTVGWAGGRVEVTTIADVALVPVPDQIAGDFDGDDDVEGADFLAWQSTVGATVAPRGGGADADRDGLVDAGDLALWQENFGASPGAAANVPEPGAALLATAGLLIAAARRARARP
jgi:hypothetical protein